MVDQSRLYGGAGGGVPGGAGTPGSAGAAGGAVGGTGTAAAPGQALDLTLGQVRAKFQPPEPAYPDLARSARVQGTVVVQVEVGADGVPVSARALQGPFLLRSAAIAHAMAWRFYPYLMNGVPRTFHFTLTVSYTLK